MLEVTIPVPKYTLFKSEYGMVTGMAWCEKEAERINQKAGREVAFVKEFRLDNARRTPRCTVYRTDMELVGKHLVRV